jgi:hypothetical protein
MVVLKDNTVMATFKFFPKTAASYMWSPGTPSGRQMTHGSMIMLIYAIIQQQKYSV